MDEYICKIASLDEMNTKWDYEIANAGEDKNNWIIWKKCSIEHMLKGKSIPYYGILDGKIISEATAILDGSIAQNSDGLVNEKTAYLSAFRTIPEYQGKGIATIVLGDIQSGNLISGFNRIEVSIDENNIASVRLFEKMGFDFVSKEDELLNYVYKVKKES